MFPSLKFSFSKKKEKYFFSHSLLVRELSSRFFLLFYASLPYLSFFLRGKVVYRHFDCPFELFFLSIWIIHELDKPHCIILSWNCWFLTAILQTFPVTVKLTQHILLQIERCAALIRVVFHVTVTEMDFWFRGSKIFTKKYVEQVFTNLLRKYFSAANIHTTFIWCSCHLSNDTHLLEKI